MYSYRRNFSSPFPPHSPHINFFCFHEWWEMCAVLQIRHPCCIIYNGWQCSFPPSDGKFSSAAGLFLSASNRWIQPGPFLFPSLDNPTEIDSGWTHQPLHLTWITFTRWDHLVSSSLPTKMELAVLLQPLWLNFHYKLLFSFGLHWPNSNVFSLKFSTLVGCSRLDFFPSNSGNGDHLFPRAHPWKISC